MSTSDWLDLETLGSRPIMSKIIPRHCSAVKPRRPWIHGVYACTLVHWEDENTLNYYIAFELLYVNSLTWKVVLETLTFIDYPNQ